jgi:AcrR family transcriptional regulator
MAMSRRRAARKPPTRYHHGDLRRALLTEAVRTIGVEGVQGLTLREVGSRLGVSRTALYRHFASKSALLAAVARDGFERFRQDLVAAWEQGGGGREGLSAMGRAYVAFALANPSHYRVMFGHFREQCEHDPDLTREAQAAFQVLVDAVEALQRARELRTDDPATMARFIWATVHGIAMLAIDGQLAPEMTEALVQYATNRTASGVADRPGPASS